MFNIKAAVMAAYTLNTRGLHWREMYAVIRRIHTHTHGRQPYIIYITTQNDMHLPVIYTHIPRELG